ncbi:hypothetical protein AXE76_03605 [Gardnerella vaginalis]|uniref:Uncharacterized protein n=1 Tax=Gardnerella vaginalis TaxID=2702 RepID=A0A3E1IRF8_GARVA|nr:hypothetical protein AXE76_03605 [Gardnerella vaginalis]
MPCSVKAYGKYLKPPQLEVKFLHLKFLNSSAHMQLFYKTLQEKQQIDGRDQNDHKRRRIYRQMFPKPAKTTTNAGKVAHVWSDTQPQTLQTRENHPAFGEPRCAALKQVVSAHKTQQNSQ